MHIEDVDVEACCGTHADNTSEVGWVKIIKSARVSDGILRLYYMAGKKVMKALNDETLVINQLKDLWGVKLEDIVGTANRFFKDTKKFEKINQNQKLALLGMQVRCIEEQKETCFVVPTFETEPRLYFSSVNTHLAPVVFSGKTIIFVNEEMLYGLISNPDHIDIEKLKAILIEDSAKKVEEKDKLEVKPAEEENKFIIKKGLQASKGK